MARPRLPQALKELRGTAKPCRTNRAQPRPARGVPTAPEYLSDRAKDAWTLLGGLLKRSGVITEQDGCALELLCEAWADLQSARAALRAHGSTTYSSTKKDGGVIWRAYPEVALASDADRRLGFWLSKFGLTPADISRVSAKTPKGDNPFNKFSMLNKRDR